MLLLKSLSRVSLLLGAALVAASSADDEALQLFQPKRYIVEYSDAGSAKFRKRDGSRASLKGARIDVGHRGFRATLLDTGADVELAQSFTSEIFHGASFDLENATEEEIEQIQNLPEVKNIWPATYLKLDVKPTVILERVSDIGAWDPHGQTNVTRVHEQGILGEGVVVAVVDSGIDYTHPAFGGGVGPGFKVESGWNVIENKADFKDCHGHGTHVAGIIASGDEFITGVAPKARLRGYKVFGCTGGSTEDVVMQGLLKAFEDGADVINASIGSDLGFPNTAIGNVISRIQAEGTLAVIAASNEGRLGPWFSSRLTNNIGGLAVGSIEHDSFAGREVTAFSSNGESRKIVYISSDLAAFNLTGNVTVSWVSGDTRTFNPCVPFASVPTIPNNNVLVVPRRTSCEWQVHDNRMNNKVDWVFWFNERGLDYEVPDRLIYDTSVQPVGSALISWEDGDWLVRQREARRDVKLVFDRTSAPVGVVRASEAGGKMNDFSSWGPTIDGRFVPQISAPGGSIFNTWLDGTWAQISGTSMAAPYVAGVSALVLSAHGTRATRDDAAAYARRRIIASGRSVLNEQGTAKASIAKQGAGVVDAVKAVQYSVTVNPSYLELNDTAHLQATHRVEVTNEVDAEVTYKLSHKTEPTYLSRDPATRQVVRTPSPLDDSQNAATAALSTSELVLAPGETGSFEVTFQEPEGGEPATFPLYGGAIVITGSDGETVKVAYQGIKGNIDDFSPWAGDSRPFLDESGEALKDGGKYSFTPGTGVPYAPFFIAFSTREWSFDFVDRDWTPEDWSWPLVPGQSKFQGHFRTTGDGFDFVVADFPIRDFPRTNQQWWARPTGTLAHGGRLGDGEYRILRRGLKTFGDPGSIEGWHWDLSSWFSVERGAAV